MRKIGVDDSLAARGISLYRMTSRPVCKEKGEYRVIRWEDAGLVFSGVKTRDAFLCMVRAFCPQHDTLRIDPSRVQDLLQKARESDLPLKVMSPVPDQETLAQGVVEKDGAFLHHFVVLDYAYIVEYKYVVTKDGYAGRLERVLVAGVKKPRDGSMLPTTKEQLRGQEDYAKCRHFLDGYKLSKASGDWGRYCRKLWMVNRMGVS